MTAPVVYTTEQQRLDIASVRFALTQSPAGPDRRRAAEAFERLLRRWARSEDDTAEVAIESNAPASSDRGAGDAGLTSSRKDT